MESYLDMSVHGILTAGFALKAALDITKPGFLDVTEKQESRIYVTGNEAGVPKWIVVESASLQRTAASQLSGNQPYSGIIVDVGTHFADVKKRTFVGEAITIGPSLIKGGLLVLSSEDFPQLFHAIGSLGLMQYPCEHGISIGINSDDVGASLSTLRTDTQEMHLPPYLTVEDLNRHGADWALPATPEFSAALLEGVRLCGEKWVQRFGSNNPPPYSEYAYMRQIYGMADLFKSGTTLGLSDLFRQSRDILALTWKFYEDDPFDDFD